MSRRGNLDQVHRAQEAMRASEQHHRAMADLFGAAAIRGDAKAMEALRADVHSSVDAWLDAIAAYHREWSAYLRREMD